MVEENYQNPLFVQGVVYDKKPQTFYFHFVEDYEALGVPSMGKVLLYTSKPGNFTLGLEKIVRLVEENGTKKVVKRR